MRSIRLPNKKTSRKDSSGKLGIRERAHEDFCTLPLPRERASLFGANANQLACKASDCARMRSIRLPNKKTSHKDSTGKRGIRERAHEDFCTLPPPRERASLFGANANQLACKASDCARMRSIRLPNKKTSHKDSSFCLVGEAGFGPAKSVTTDLQSAPFGRSGIPPYYNTGAGERSRTINLLITNQLLCH